METRPAAAMISSLVSQAILLLLLLFQSNPNLFILSSPFSKTLTTLLHLLSSSHAAVTAARPRIHRKRRLEIEEKGIYTEDDDEEEDEEGGGANHKIIESEANPCSALIAPYPNPDHFKLHFGMRSSTFEWLSSLLDPFIDTPSGLPAPTRLALALSRLSTGAPYSDLASRFSVPTSIARFCARRLCRVLCTNFRFWLAFPSTPKLLRPVSDGFSSLAGLPGCCGAIASASFRLQHGTATASLVSDISSRILSFAAGGSSAFGAFSKTSLFKEAAEGRILGPEQYFVGDENQLLYPWLMVPFADPVPASCQEDFNLALRVMCWPARRAVYSLHNWRVLGRLEEEGAKAAVAFIGTCALLHNVLLMKDDDSALADVAGECLLTSEQLRDEEMHDADSKAILLRNSLALKARECGAL